MSRELAGAVADAAAMLEKVVKEEKFGVRSVGAISVRNVGFEKSIYLTIGNGQRGPDKASWMVIRLWPINFDVLIRGPD